MVICTVTTVVVVAVVVVVVVVFCFFVTGLGDKALMPILPDNDACSDLH